MWCCHNGRRLSLFSEGADSLNKKIPAQYSAGKFIWEEGDTMDILEVLALLSFALACIKFGYIIGRNAK